MFQSGWPNRIGFTSTKAMRKWFSVAERLEIQKLDNRFWSGCAWKEPSFAVTRNRLLWKAFVYCSTIEVILMSLTLFMRSNREHLQFCKHSVGLAFFNARRETVPKSLKIVSVLSQNLAELSWPVSAASDLGSQRISQTENLQLSSAAVFAFIELELWNLAQDRPCSLNFSISSRTKTSWHGGSSKVKRIRSSESSRNHETLCLKCSLLICWKERFFCLSMSKA